MRTSSEFTSFVDNLHRNEALLGHAFLVPPPHYWLHSGEHYPHSLVHRYSVRSDFDEFLDLMFPQRKQKKDKNSFSLRNYLKELKNGMMTGGLFGLKLGSAVSVVAATITCTIGVSGIAAVSGPIMILAPLVGLLLGSLFMGSVITLRTIFQLLNSLFFAKKTPTLSTTPQLKIKHKFKFKYKKNKENQVTYDPMDHWINSQPVNTVPIVPPSLSIPATLPNYNPEYYDTNGNPKYPQMTNTV